MAEGKLIKMQREVAGQLQEADVHPDEVANYQKGGWAPRAKKTKDTTIAGADGDSGDTVQAPGSEVKESGEGEGKTE